jgi:hypothetical protein
VPSNHRPLSAGNQAILNTLSHGKPDYGARGDSMKGWVWLGIGLIVAWAILWLGIKLAAFAVHLLLIIGVALIGWGLLQRSTAGKRP